jgi:hypothetical protein
MKPLLSIVLALAFAGMLSVPPAHSQIQMRVNPENRERHHVVYHHQLRVRARVRVSEPMRHHVVRPQMERRNDDRRDEVRHENH